MSQEKATVHPIGTATPPQAKPARAKATEVLPSERITFAKHLALLRAYAAASGQNLKPVKTIEVGAVANTQPTTISSANAFFITVGLIQRTEGGFIPSPEVMAFAHAYEWNPNDPTASHKLAPLIGQTWFAKEVLKRLSFEHKLKESDAVTSLAQLSSAPPECKLQVKLLIDYLEAAGLVQRDGDYLKKGSSASPATSAERQAPAPTGTPPPPPSEPEHRDVTHREAPPARSSVSTAFSQMAGGAVQFNVTVKVDMNEFKGWQPDRIAAFFHGIAEVLAAKGGMEKDVSSE
ncbi:MAG TPA: hypothetical protein VF543_06320 [Pyrinomonadaceae bacterium]|jgi:hypothetical protein